MHAKPFPPIFPRGELPSINQLSGQAIPWHSNSLSWCLWINTTLIKEASFDSGWWLIETHSCPTAGRKRTVEGSSLNGTLWHSPPWEAQRWPWNREQKDCKSQGGRGIRRNRVSGRDQKVAHGTLRHLWLHQARAGTPELPLMGSLSQTHSA